jgi:hypothetical protein
MQLEWPDAREQQRQRHCRAGKRGALKLPCHIHTSDIIQNRDELAYGNPCKFFVIDSAADEFRITAPAASANQPSAPGPRPCAVVY